MEVVTLESLKDVKSVSIKGELIVPVDMTVEQLVHVIHRVLWQNEGIFFKGVIK